MFLWVIQVAHFYNTIDQQMIPCQRAMMLESALAFEKLIKNPKTGTIYYEDENVFFISTEVIQS